MPHILLRPYVLSIRNHLVRSPNAKQNIKRDLLLLTVAGLVMLCVFLGVYLILNGVKADPLFSEIIPQKILALGCYAFFLLLLISNTISAVGNIYAADNMNLFLSTPVSNLRLYCSKLIESLIETSLMFFVFSSPAILAYTVVLPVEGSFFFKALLVSIPYLLIPAGLSVVIATIFMKVAPMIWKRGLFLLICLFGTGTWLLVEILALLQKVKVEYGGANAVVQLIGFFDNPNPLWLPSRWTADILTSSLGGQTEYLSTNITLLLSAALGSLALGYLFFDLFVLRIRSSSSIHKRSESGAVTSSDFVRRMLEKIYHSIPMARDYRAIILKDLTSLVRDRAQSLQLLLYLGIAGAYVIVFKFMSAALNLSVFGLQTWWAFLQSINILFAGFIVTALMTRLVYPSISLEGRAFWILRVAPIDTSRLVAAKFWCWLPLTSLLTLTLLLAGLAAIGASWDAVVCTMITGIALSIGCNGLAIGIGAIFAKFAWESTNQISVGLGTLILLFASLGLVIITAIPASVVTFLTVIPALRNILGHPESYLLMSGCMFLIIIMNAMVCHYALKRGARSLQSRSRTEAVLY